MGTQVAILEDNAARIDEMLTCLAEVLPGCEGLTSLTDWARQPMRRLQVALVGVSVVVCVAASGCIPATVVEMPAVTGRVVDSGGRPVGGATVEIAPDAELSSGLRAIYLNTEKDGRFHSNERVRWAMVFPFIPADAVGPGSMARASSRNLRSDAKPFGGGIVQVRWFGVFGRLLGLASAVDLGQLVLHRESTLPETQPNVDTPAVRPARVDLRSQN